MTPKIADICTANLLALSDAYMKHRGIISTTLSRKILGDQQALDKIRRREGSTTLDKFDFAMRWFDENWPADLHWPELEAVPGSESLVHARRSQKPRRLPAA